MKLRYLRTVAEPLRPTLRGALPPIHKVRLPHAVVDLRARRRGRRAGLREDHQGDAVAEDGPAEDQRHPRGRGHGAQPVTESARACGVVGTFTDKRPLPVPAVASQPRMSVVDE